MTSLPMTAESVHVEENFVSQGVDTSIQDHNEVITCGSMCDKYIPRNRDNKCIDQENVTDVLRVSCLKLEIKEVRCYEAKIEESEKSRRESNPGHLWLEPPVLCH